MTLRLIHILVPEQDQPDVFSHLEDEGIDFRVLSKDSDTNAVVVQFSLPTPAVEEVLSDPEYDNLGLVAVEGRFGQIAVLDEPQKVTVVVKRPADSEFPHLAPSLQQRLTARMDRPIVLEVEFRDTTVARPDRAAIPGSD